jgi:copper oxidase (laccase) domain-containing protein
MSSETIAAEIPYPEYSTLESNSPRVIVSAGDFPVDLPENLHTSMSKYRQNYKVGNMSPKHGQLDRPELNISPQDFQNLSLEEQTKIIEQREVIAHENLVRFLEGSGIDPADVVIMKPQMDNKQPVGIVDADQIPRSDTYQRSSDAATMIYSRDKDRVLAALTGDSPFMVGHGMDNEGQHVQFMTHLGWRVEEADYVRKSLEYARTLGLDLTQTHFVITPGAEKLDFTKRGEGKDERFMNENWEGNIQPVPPEEAQVDKERLRISMVGFATDLLEKFGIESGQIFVHGSDTTDKRTRYSSDRRSQASKGEIPTSRDAVVATMPNYPGYNTIQERFRERRGHSLGKKAVQS